tara:strand:+ start:484 stop:903 length:420 start_codon:yes stop_codon:yes gene_type:complete
MQITKSRIQEIVFEELSALLNELTEKKQRKQHCTPGNVFHKPASPPGSTKPNPTAGQFTSKPEAGSWSLQWASKENDCAGKKAGVVRMPGEKFIKGPSCGRADKDGGKAKRKCSVKEENGELLPSPTRTIKIKVQQKRI